MKAREGRAWSLGATNMRVLSAVFAALLILSNTVSAVPPSQCARAQRITGGVWVFKNDCDFHVYWNTVCQVGAAAAWRCFGSGKVVVRSGSEKEVDLKQAPLDIYGPYR